MSGMLIMDNDTYISERLNAFNRKYREAFKGEEIVLGSGSCRSDILLVGEAPGRDEVKLSKPFVGMAGRQLEEFLKMMEIKRQDIYITNAIKYRLLKYSEKTGRTSNRPARKDEIICNRQFLLEEIDLIRPLCIVTLGNVPLRCVTGDFSLCIGEYHGKLINTAVMGKEYRLFPLYHPASIIYNRSLKDVYINDIKKLKKIFFEMKQQKIS